MLLSQPSEDGATDVVIDSGKDPLSAPRMAVEVPPPDCGPPVEQSPPDRSKASPQDRDLGFLWTRLAARRRARTVPLQSTAGRRRYFEVH